MPGVIAVCTGRCDVAFHVAPALGLRHQVLRGALEPGVGRRLQPLAGSSSDVVSHMATLQ